MSLRLGCAAALSFMALATCVSAAPPESRAGGEPGAASLAAVLKEEGVPSLARAALGEGDAGRGAGVFRNPVLGCAKCHGTGRGFAPLGPELTRLGDRATAEHVVESILEPSKTIRDEFRPVQIVRTDGRVVVGLPYAERPAHVELRDPSRPGRLMSIAKQDIEERTVSPVSLMPAEIVAQLRDRRQFLDLVRYVVEIGRGGPEAAARLAPQEPASKPVVPKFDHAARIRALGEADVTTGRALYRQHCVSCHGTDGNKTINPLARRFAKDPLKFGTDPYSLWRTISHGAGLMLPQAVLMTPDERYSVVHFLREEFVRPGNPTQLFAVTDAYLAGIDAVARADAERFAAEAVQVDAAPGMVDGTLGARMEYGPCATHSVAFEPFKVSDGDRYPETTERALIVGLPGPVSVCYDTERGSVAGIWTGKLASTLKTHHTSYKGSTCLAPGGPVLYRRTDEAGWAVGTSSTPATGDALRFRGHRLFEDRVLLEFDVGGRSVEEIPLALADEPQIVARRLRVGPGSKRVMMLVARRKGGEIRLRDKLDAAMKTDTEEIVAVLGGGADGVRFFADYFNGLWVEVPPSIAPRHFVVWTGYAGETAGKRSADDLRVRLAALRERPDVAFDAFRSGGPRRWLAETLTRGVPGEPVEGYAADVLTVPLANPWGCWMRTTALDFFSDGRMAASTLSGDVWIAQWTGSDISRIEWTRFASGLYEPLGLRIVDDTVFVRARDRIVRLVDVNGDGEADSYENFFQEGEIGPGYHAFLFDLQTDRAGNFYFAKSGRKAPHEGAVIRVAPDGRSFETICRDFRHPNGMGAGGPHDWITVSDNPDGKAVFNGVALVRSGGRHGYAAPRNTPMLAVLPPNVDSSSGGQGWADPVRWGPLGGQMIHTSYSRNNVFYVLTQALEPYPNGFAVRLPFDLPSGALRARTNPVDGQVYVVAQKGWDSQAKIDGYVTRIRYVGGPSHLVTGAAADSRGIRLTFACDVDPASLGEKSVLVAREDVKTTTPVAMDGVRLVDPRTLEIRLPQIADEVLERRTRKDEKTGAVEVTVRAPLRITLSLRAADGAKIAQVVYATINALPKEDLK